MTINRDVLTYLLEAEMFEKRSPAHGIASFLMENDLGDLSEKQKYVFEKEIRPMLEPKCDGVIGEGCENFGGLVDDESIVQGYMTDEMLCQICRYDKEKI